jgi:hypothetical protein
MSLASIRNAYEVYQRHDFSLSNNFRLISILGCPDYVSREINEKPYGEGGALYIKSASVPGRTVVDIPIQYHGFEFHKPGAVKYDDNPWSVTFKTPGDYLVRNALEAWHNELFSDETSCGRTGVPCPNSVIRIGLTDASCNIIRVYDLIGVYPSKISNIEYDLESTALTQFSVDFYYQYWRLVPNFDTGSIDSTTVEQAKIAATYAEYHSDIMQTEEKC